MNVPDTVRLQSKAGAIVHFEDLPAPIERHHTGSKPGKTVVTLAD